MPSTLRVTIARGPRAGSTFVVEPGVPAVIGRAHDAQIAIDSPGLSRRHCELTWDGRIARVRDLGSRNGVMLNGRDVKESVFGHGDEIEAGDCILRVDLEGRRIEPIVEPPGPSDQDEPEPTPRPTRILGNVTPGMAPLPEEDAVSAQPDPPLLAQVLDRSRDDGSSVLYALVDGAQAFDLVCQARLMGCPVYTLFVGGIAEAMAHVGPCLIPLSAPQPFCRLWLGRLGESAGVLLCSRATLDELFVHLRKIFVVTDEEGQEFFFRYYDPRVFRTFLPTCSRAELDEFFGPVNRWFVETAEQGLTSYSLGEEGISEEQFPVGDAPPVVPHSS